MAHCTFAIASYQSIFVVCCSVRGFSQHCINSWLTFFYEGRRVTVIGRARFYEIVNGWLPVARGGGE